MPDRFDTTTWTRARRTALMLRQTLADRGVPDDLLRQIVPKSDLEGRQYVSLGTWPVDHVDRLLAALAANPAPAAAGS